MERVPLTTVIRSSFRSSLGDSCSAASSTPLHHHYHWPRAFSSRESTGVVSCERRRELIDTHSERDRETERERETDREREHSRGVCGPQTTMAPSAVCRKKLSKEHKALCVSPPDFIPLVHVNEKNVCDWHFVIQGPPDSPYDGGFYVGRVRFPDDYPFKPPSLSMVTPSGRFEVNVRLCLSMSDFHPEAWTPGWSVATILTGMLSFMLENAETTGSVRTTDDEKKRLAADSLRWNMENATVKRMFPTLPQLAEKAKEKASSSGSK